MMMARSLWLLVAALLTTTTTTTTCAATIELTNGTVYECRSGGESITLFSLPIGQAPEDLLLVVEVFFLAAGNRTGEELAVTVTTDDKPYTIKYSERSAGSAIGTLGELIFEADPEILTNLKADFGTPSPKPPTPPPGGMRGMPGMPGMPDEDGH